MLERVGFVDWSKGNHVEVYADAYAYDSVSMSLHLVSLAGNDSAVKAVSAAIVGGREITIHPADSRTLHVAAGDSLRYRILSVKLSCGAVHQIVADKRFFLPGEQGDHLLLVPPERKLPDVIYEHVLSHIASPVIPQWAEWICSRLSDERLLRDLNGTFRVVEVRADESILDRIVSEGIARKHIELSNAGGTYAGENTQRERLSSNIRRGIGQKDPIRSTPPFPTR